MKRFSKQLKQDHKEGKKEENIGNNVVIVVVASRATSHVTARKDFFLSYTSLNPEVLKMGNVDEVKVFDLGIVYLITNNGSMLVL